MRSTVPALLFCMAAPVTQAVELCPLYPIAAPDVVPSVSGGLFSRVAALTEIGRSDTQQSFWVEVTPDSRPVTREIAAYAQLAHGWDGDDGRPAMRWSIDAATTFVASLPFDIFDPSPMISSAGEVGLYWVQGDAYAEIGFDEAGTCFMFAEAPNMKSIHLDEVSPNDPILLAGLRTTLGLTENVLLAA